MLKSPSNPELGRAPAGADRARWLVVAALCAVFTQTAGSTASEPAVAEQVLDEVVVSGTRLWNLRQDVIKADDAFYALFNQLNQDDDFDMHCRDERLIGLHITKRMCRPGYLEAAQQDEARETLARINGQPATVSPPPEHVLLQRETEWRDNLLRVINSDPRLQQLFRERERLQRRYEAERDRRAQAAGRR